MLYKIKEVSQLLKISTPLLYKLAEKGEIGCVKIGAALRFSDENVKQFITKCSKEANK